MSGVSDIFIESTIYDPEEFEDCLNWKSQFSLEQLFPNDFDVLLSTDSQPEQQASVVSSDTAVVPCNRSTSPQPQIRYHDCMWSGRCVSHQDKKKGVLTQGYQSKTHAKHNVQQSCSSVRNASNGSAQIVKYKTGSTTVTAPTIQSRIQSTSNTAQSAKSIRHVPAGTSLLLKSRFNSTQQQQQQQQQHKRQQQQQCKMRVQSMNQNQNQLLSSNYALPRSDTPLSLDEDPTEFKHNVDLSACIMGSNQLNLDLVPKAKAISILKEHLEESTTETYSGGMSSLFSPTTPSTQFGQSFIKSFATPGNGVDGGGGGGTRTVSMSSELYNDAISVMKAASDSKSDDEDDEIESDAFDDNSDIESGNNTSSSSNGSISSGIGSLVSSSGNSCVGHHNTTTHSDHSYTRNKNRVDVIGLGVETPSDSEEEIDVVSVHDKTLPTNPSAKDRRALQSRLSARIVKTSKNIKTIPARRRCSEESYSSSLTSPGKSSSGYGSNGFPSDYSSSTSTSGNGVNARLTSSSSMSGYTTSPTNGRYLTNSRKRGYVSTSANSSITPTTPSSTKRHRGKKQRLSNKRQNSDSDEADTIEKRNLHNDMERQRRIGLKNLFEELKKQIPCLSDKERAPKVNILREAAELCRKLNREQEEIEALKMQQEMLLSRVRVLRTNLANKRLRCAEQQH